MAHPNPDPLPADLVQVLRDRQHDLVLRLFTNQVDLAAVQSVDDFQEANYPGYRPLSIIDWHHVGLDTGVRSIALAASWIVTKRGNDPVPAVRGVYCTLRRHGEADLLLGAEPFADLVPMDRDGQTLRIEVGLGAVSAALPDQSRHLLRLRVNYFVYLAGGGGVELRGEERALVNRILFDLAAVARRDADIARLSPRSQKSRIPVIDPDQPGLTTAYETIRRRLQDLLNL